MNFFAAALAVSLSGWAAPAIAELPRLQCLHSGSGVAYEVGPGQAFATIGAVPWEGLNAGDTVRIHYRAEPYREKILIRRQGTQAQPIVVCGVPGPGGELPILDGENATTRPTMGYRPTSGAGEVRGLIHVSWSATDLFGFKPEHIVIQGLHIRRAFHEYSFTASTGATMNYSTNAAGIFVERGENITVRGVILEGNGNGFFVASGDSEEVLSRDIVLERSRLFGNGTVTVAFDRHHNVYTEAAGMLIQYNQIGPLRPGSGGSAVKDRSAGTVIRYNAIAGGARSLDLVEAQDAFPLLGLLPEYRRTFVYGNTIVSDGVGGPTNMIHYGGDSGLENTYRKGRLHFNHNTIVIRADQSVRYRTVLFDVSTNEETVDARNNLVFARAQTNGAIPTELSWMRTAGVLQLGVNGVSPGILDFRTGVPSTGSVSGQANVLSNAGNDPGFENEAGNDFHLREGSQARNAGQALHADALTFGHAVASEYVEPASGQLRSPDGAPDLGAFELSARVFGNGFEETPAGNGRHAAKGGVAHPWQFLGKGPEAYDDGLRANCTGIAGTAPRVWCARAGAAGGGIGTAAAPFASINAAIAAAAAGDIVQVAAGTYAENVALGSFAVPSAKNLTLRGGFNADFSQRNAGLNRSVINGGGVAPAVQLHVDSIGTTTLDGFELVNGRGLGSDFSDGSGRGAGVFARQFGNGVMLLSHNEIHDNVTANFGDEARGGGIHTYNPPLVDGGGTGVMRIEDNYVHDNRAGRGAGINVTGIQARVLRNRIENNLGESDHGGGLYVSTVSTEVKDNAIHGNEIGVGVGYGWGGGAVVAAANADFEGNVITNNFAPSIGSGVFWDEGATGTHRNDLFFGNRCTNDGRQGTAIYVDGGDPGPSIVNLQHVTIANHDCPGTSATGGAIFLEALSQAHLRNSILWGNTREFGDDGSAVIYSVGYSTSAQPGVGNALADPLFANPATGDYHLRSVGGRFTPAAFVIDAVTSPAIDAGDPGADFSRETMPNGGRVNQGAYGNTPEASRSLANDSIFKNGFE